jgi:hypothetical protein
MEPVLELEPETITTELLSIPKPVTEDVLLTTTTSSNAESMVDQTKMTQALKLMSNAQVFHGDHITLRLVKNSESPEKVGYKEEAEEFGDQSHPTTSGTTTMVQSLFAEILDLPLVLELEPEIHTTENNTIIKLETEDVLHQTLASFNAANTVETTWI